MRRLIALLVAVLLLPALPLAADPVAPPTTRLARLGTLWGTVRYLHPYVVTREVDWDAALLAALPKVQAARSRDEYRDAVQHMLDALEDPVTRVLPKASPPPAASEPIAPVALFREAPGGVLVVELARHLAAGGQREAFAAVNTLPERLKAAKAVVVDLRMGAMSDDALQWIWFVLEGTASAFASRPVRGPSQRYVLHSGYQTQAGASTGGYFSGVVTTSATLFEPPPGTAPKRIVFVIDGRSWVPPILHALTAAVDAHVVTEGDVTDAFLIDSREVDIGEGLTARVRTAEMQGGWSSTQAHVAVPKDSGAHAIDAAIAHLGTAWPRPEALPAMPNLPQPVFRAERAYEEMQAPDLAHRQLAVIRAWNVIQYFYPYKHLIGDWDAVLPTSLANMEDAGTARDYALALLEMMAHVADGHTTLSGRPDVEHPFGEAGLPIQVRWTEGHPVVWRVSEAARSAGLAVGDAIVTVDDEPVTARVDRMSRYVAASTRASLLQRLASRHLLAGPAGSTAGLTVQKVDGAVRDVRLVRETVQALPPADKGDVIRILPGNLGYVDLSRLALPEVDGMFTRLEGTRGLIFDLRGYPQGTAWAIAPRINTRKAKYAAQFRRTQVAGLLAEEGESGYFFSQPLPALPDGTSTYARPTVTIIDDRAGSQAEHTGLFFEAANGTTFVGTATAGANGDVTRFPVPGGIWITFTGHDVRHADGRQLQRVGIVPDVEVAPTRAGLEAGVDEVLSKAIEVLEKKIAER